VGRKSAVSHEAGLTSDPEPDDLANLIKLLLVSSTYLFNQTPRAVRRRAEPPKFQYSQQYANLVSHARPPLNRLRVLLMSFPAQQLLISAVGLIYAPLAPLVAAFAAFALTISSATFKYQLAYVFCSEVDTGGEAWPVVVSLPNPSARATAPADACTSESDRPSAHQCRPHGRLPRSQ